VRYTVDPNIMTFRFSTKTSNWWSFTQGMEVVRRSVADMDWWNGIVVRYRATRDAHLQRTARRRGGLLGEPDLLRWSDPGMPRSISSPPWGSHPPVTTLFPGGEIPFPGGAVMIGGSESRDPFKRRGIE
jgi:hypothetical protein